MKRGHHCSYGYATATHWTGAATMSSGFTAGARLHRDVDRRWLAGVLAGMASHFGWNLVALRIVVLVAACTPFVPVIIVGYALAAMVLPARSRIAEGAAATPPPPPAAAPYAAPANVSASELRYRIREMEDRLRAMEAYVTSTQYEIDRELRTPGK